MKKTHPNKFFSSLFVIFEIFCSSKIEQLMAILYSKYKLVGDLIFEPNTGVSNTYTDNRKKLCNFFIREFPVEKIDKCNRVGICCKHYRNFSQQLQQISTLLHLPILSTGNSHNEIGKKLQCYNLLYISTVHHSNFQNQPNL